MFRNISVIFTISILIYLFICSGVSAQSRLESDHFKIQFPNFNSGAGVPTSANYGLNATIGQGAQGMVTSSNYTVRAGFQYIHTIIPFSFSVSNTSITFNDLIPETPDTRSATLTVKAGGAGGYSVKAYESHPLALDNDPLQTKIPDTLCDSGPCSQTQAELWTSGSTYGFGFNMSGDDVPADFSTSDYYRQFADASLPESAATIMTKSDVTWDYPNNAWPWESEATITFKINIQSTQSAGTYNNIIKFIAVPSF